MKESEIHVAQKSRRVPYHLEEPWKKWLEEGEAEGIFEHGAIRLQFNLNQSMQTETK